MAKDEGPRLLEWLAYHRLIGFDAVWIYTNDCRDGTDAMLDRLQEMDLVRHLRNVVPEGKKPQPHALTLAQKNAEILSSDWLLPIDLDEFLHVKAPGGGVQDLLDACPTGTDGVAIGWRMMGSNGHKSWSSEPILDQFTRGAPEGYRRGWGVKTLFRPFEHLRLGIHRPTVKGAKRDPARMEALRSRRWVNGSGVPMPPSFLADGWRYSAATRGYALAEIAHFGVQSAEAYLLRGDRGNVNLKQGKYDATYFAMFDRNEVALPALSAWSNRVQALVTEWLGDPVLNSLYGAAIDWHKARLKALKSGPSWAERMSKLRQASDVPLDQLGTLLFTQPLAPAGKKLVAELRAKGQRDAEIAKAVSATVQRLERARDAREARELEAMGIKPMPLG